VISGRERGDGAETAGVDLPFSSLRSRDVPRGEEAVGDAGDEVGCAVGRAVVAVAWALEVFFFFWGGGERER